MLPFFPRGVLDEILNLIESVSEGFPSCSWLFDGSSTLCAVLTLLCNVQLYYMMCYVQEFQNKVLQSTRF